MRHTQMFYVFSCIVFGPFALCVSRFLKDAIHCFPCFSLFFLARNIFLFYGPVRACCCHPGVFAKIGFTHATAARGAASLALPVTSCSRAPPRFFPPWSVFVIQDHVRRARHRQLGRRRDTLPLALLVSSLLGRLWMRRARAHAHFDKSFVGKRDRPPPKRQATFLHVQGVLFSVSLFFRLQVKDAVAVRSNGRLLISFLHKKKRGGP